MTPSENRVVEGNKIIAEFDGWQKSLYQSRPHTLFNPSLGKSIDDDMLNYHESWSLLMPVVTKIMMMQFEDGENTYLRTFGMRDEQGNVMVRFNRYGLFSAETLIEATYYAVLEYIESYNTTAHAKKEV